MDLSRIESGHINIQLEPITIAPLIKSCAVQLQPLASYLNVSFTFELNPTATIQADRLRLREILLNLLSNAVKYNRENGHVYVSCVPVGGNRLRVSVRDNGRGIAAEALPRLFKPFERLESAYHGIEGTGIGLALVKNLVLAMNGIYGVESVQGAGSTFWFELPLATTDEAIIEPEDTGINIVAVGARHKILYVEDNFSNMALMQKIIALHGDLDLLVAGSAEAGLEVAVKERPDLILLDIQLPGMDGFEVLQHLRNDPATRDIPVVAVTANAMMRDRERGVAAGFNEYLTKPIDIALLFTMLERILN